MTNEDEAVDFGLDALMAEFKDLDLKRKKAREDAHIWLKESRWTRLVRWLKDHPGEHVEMEGIYSNSVQRLKRRFPGLIVIGARHRYLPMTEAEKRAGRKKGKKVCDLYLKWPG